MKPSGRFTIGTGSLEYVLTEEKRKVVAEHILLNNPELMKRAITESKPGLWDRAKEFLFNVLGF